MARKMKWKGGAPGARMTPPAEHIVQCDLCGGEYRVREGSVIYRDTKFQGQRVCTHCRRCDNWKEHALWLAFTKAVAAKPCESGGLMECRCMSCIARDVLRTSQGRRKPRHAMYHPSSGLDRLTNKYHP